MKFNTILSEIDVLAPEQIRLLYEFLHERDLIRHGQPMDDLLFITEPKVSPLKQISKKYVEETRNLIWKCKFKKKVRAQFVIDPERCSDKADIQELTTEWVPPPLRVKAESWI